MLCRVDHAHELGAGLTRWQSHEQPGLILQTVEPLEVELEVVPQSSAVVRLKQVTEWVCLRAGPRLRRHVSHQLSRPMTALNTLTRATNAAVQSTMRWTVDWFLGLLMTSTLLHAAGCTSLLPRR